MTQSQRLALSAFSRETKTIIEVRSCGRCERCGATLDANGGAVHHRRPRGSGGSMEAALAAASNGLRLCGRCHDEVERDRSSAYTFGWLVRSRSVPSERPVRLWDGWAYLNDVGGVEWLRAGAGDLGVSEIHGASDNLGVVDGIADDVSQGGVLDA